LFRYWLVPFGAALVLATALEWLIDPLAGVYQSWIFAMTVITFLTYWYDKVSAVSGRRTRVPERVLLVLALTGGTIGALVGMVLVSHKTSKESFQIKFWLIVAAQIGAFLIYRAVFI
jgi:uncharacterized membrane protein YsdA (DUF1294 family)